MIYHSDMAKDELKKNIDKTLGLVDKGFQLTTSELYDVIRWAQKGYLTRKDDMA